MFDQSNHLSSHSLTAFAKGQLEGSAHEVAEQHVLECEDCCAALRDIDVNISITAPAHLSKPVEPRPGDVGSDEMGSNSMGRHGRFLPGDVLLSRFRIVSLLGFGGMGEVYRADDLVLNQSVALKFLGDKLRGNQVALNRLNAEVRLAREINHENVCRVYDINEVDGQPFLSMEYIDGEDLQSLLKRIGRLPRDKGFDLSRQLCSGLAAAHEQGILHRDLKPANLMIDGRGYLRITDFGLATLNDDPTRDSSGTPAYMAPEQIQYGESNIQSDLYSLGLVMAEMFSGRRVIEGSTLSEVQRHHASPIPPSLHHDVPPELDAILKQCLSLKPTERPTSAEDVLAAIPSHDPLSALLATGQTPSPEQLASERFGSRPVNDTASKICLVVLLVGLVFLACVPIGHLSELVHRVEFPLEPAILSHEARQIVVDSGYFGGEDPSWPSEACGFLTNQACVSASAGDERVAKPARLNDSPYHYWYRMHKNPLSANRRLATRVTFDDPAPFEHGMVSMRLDLEGRLVEYHATPVPSQQIVREKFNFRPFFSDRLLGMSFSEFEPVAAEWTPQTIYDTLLAWKQKGVPDDEAVRLYAATYRDQLIAFRFAWPEERITPTEVPEQPIQDTTRFAIVLLLGLAAVTAYFNVSKGRSDRKGATRLAYGAFAISLLGWLLSATLTGDLNLDSMTLITGLHTAAFTAVVLWCFYLALEPFVRRFWPTALVTWTRLLRSQFRNRELGRDILLGLTAGVVCLVLTKFYHLGLQLLGIEARPIVGVTPDVLLGMRPTVAGVVDCALSALTVSMFLLMFLFAIRLPIRVKGIATVLFVVFFTVLFGLLAPEYMAIYLVFWTTSAVLLTRFGFVALLCFQFVRHVGEAYPMPANGEWYGSFAIVPLAIIGLLAVYGFFISSYSPTRSANSVLRVQSSG